MQRHPGARSPRARPRLVAAALSALTAASLAPAARAEGDPGELTPHPASAIEPPPPNIVPKVASGFATATGSLQSVPAARPRNQLDASLSTAGGLAASGSPYEHWEYLAYLVVGLSGDAVSGTGGSLSAEQITLKYAPIKELWFQAGFQRIPFSVAQSAVITNSMFPTRPEPTTTFQSGADAGFLAGYEHPQGLVRVRVGVFDGLSLGLALPNHVTHAPVVNAWVDVSPFGAMPTIEGDYGNSSFHLALGGGITYRNGIAYDPSGYEGLHVTDTRFSAAIRMAFKGLFVQGEYLQAIQTDDISGRPRIARGTYGEASYYFTVARKIGFAPVARLAWSVQDESFFPRHVVSFDSGLALYPRGDLQEPGALRFVVEFLNERHLEESETAYGALASVLYRF